MIKTCASLRALYDSFMTLILQLCYKATEWELCCINTNAYGQVSDPMYFVEENREGDNWLFSNNCHFEN